MNSVFRSPFLLSGVGELRPFFSSLRNQVVRRRGALSEPQRCSTSASSPSSSAPGQEGKKLSLFQRFKQMYKDYYYVLIPVHLVTSAGWFGGFYYASSSGVDIGKYMKKMGLSDHLVDKVTASGIGDVAVAYLLYKIATPARYTVTLAGTTWTINRLQKLGYIKPAKEIIAKGKERFLPPKGT